MKKYLTPDLELIMIQNGDIITTSVAQTPENDPGTEGPVVDVEPGQWNW